MDELQVSFLLTHEDAKAPTQGYDGDAGWDLYTSQDSVVEPGRTALVSTNIHMALPAGYWAQIISRSSTPRKYEGVTVVEAVIDNGYRGELFIQVANTGHKTHTIEKGSRIAQLVLHEIHRVKWVQQVLPKSQRGNSGFGSTGQ